MQRMIQTPRRTQELRKIMDFLKYTQGGYTLDSIQAVRKMKELWGDRHDHHVFAAAMDNMVRAGDAEFVDFNGPDGFSRWKIL